MEQVPVSDVGIKLENGDYVCEIAGNEEDNTNEQRPPSAIDLKEEFNTQFVLHDSVEISSLKTCVIEAVSSSVVEVVPLIQDTFELPIEESDPTPAEVTNTSKRVIKRKFSIDLFKPRKRKSSGLLKVNIGAMCSKTSPSKRKISTTVADVVSTPVKTPQEKRQNAAITEINTDDMFTNALPEGWTRKVVQRKQGLSAGKFDVYVFSPEGTKLRSRNDVRSYLQQKNITNLDPNDFEFAPKRKNNRSSSPKTMNQEKSPTLSSPPSTPKSKKTVSAKVVTEVSPTLKQAQKRKLSAIAKPVENKYIPNIPEKTTSVKQKKNVMGIDTPSTSNTKFMNYRPIKDYWNESPYAKPYKKRKIVSEDSTDNSSSFSSELVSGKILIKKETATDNDEDSKSPQAKKKKKLFQEKSSKEPSTLTPQTEEFRVATEDSTSTKIVLKKSKAKKSISSAPKNALEDASCDDVLSDNGEKYQQELLNGDTGSIPVPDFTPRSNQKSSKIHAQSDKRFKLPSSPALSKKVNKKLGVKMHLNNEKNKLHKGEVEKKPTDEEICQANFHLGKKLVVSLVKCDSVNGDFCLAAEEPKEDAKVWTPPKSPYNLIQESLYEDPWKLLVSTIIMKKSLAQVGCPLTWKFFEEFPTAYSVTEAPAEKIIECLFPHQFPVKCAKTLIQFSKDYLEKSWLYPKELSGIDKYGNDTYRIFCLNEWRQVKPTDFDLSLYHNWLSQNHTRLKV